MMNLIVAASTCLVLAICVCADVAAIDVSTRLFNFDLTNSTLFATPWTAAAKPLCSLLSSDVNVGHVDALVDAAHLSTTAYRVTFHSFGLVTVTLSCVNPIGDNPTVLTFVLSLNRVDKPPVCNRYQVNSLLGDNSGSPFFLQSTDSDETASYRSYEITSSLADLKGYLTYCENCSFADPSEWKNLTDILEDPTSLATFAGMFGYYPPLNALEGFSESIEYIARDLASLECDPAGKVTFRVVNSEPPVVIAPGVPFVVAVNNPQTIRISARTSVANNLAFILERVPLPSCAYICPIPPAVIESLAMDPVEVIRGLAVDCDAASALTLNSNITLESLTNVFFMSTYVVLKAITNCSGTFSVVATDGITFSLAEDIPFVAQAPRIGKCNSLRLDGQPSQVISFNASQVFTAVQPVTWNFMGWVDAHGEPKPLTAQYTMKGKPLFIGPNTVNPWDVVSLQPSADVGTYYSVFIVTFADDPVGVRCRITFTCFPRCGSRLSECWCYRAQHLCSDCHYCWRCVRAIFGDECEVAGEVQICGSTRCRRGNAGNEAQRQP